MMEKKAKGSCYASFGELLQGAIPGNISFLVNCPITHKSTVEIFIKSNETDKETQNIEPVPPCYAKTDAILRNILREQASHFSYQFQIDSNIPISKGLSSSTADMVAAIRGLEKALSTKFDPDYISKMLTEIEPNDGLHYTGIAAYCHRRGKLLNTVSEVPSLTIVGIDIGGRVETIDFNAKKPAFNLEELQAYEVLLKQLLDALAKKDLEKIGEISTESAKRWQRINYKSELDSVIAIAEKCNALGIINTHSGSYLGILFRPNDPNIAKAEAELERLYPNCNINLFNTISEK